jgi:hypothetical protein
MSVEYPNMTPIDLPPHELLARLEDLGMPDGSAVICQALSPLDALDPRLAGCTWKVLGREVPLTDGLPDYYFLRFNVDGVPSRQVQIWLWQVLPRDPPAYVEYRWHPTADAHVDYVQLPANPRTHLAAVRRPSPLSTIVRGDHQKPPMWSMRRTLSGV